MLIWGLSVRGTSPSFVCYFSMKMIKVGNLTVKLCRDDFIFDPRKEFDWVGTMACFHRRYTLGDCTPECSLEEYLHQMMAEREYSLHRKWIPDDIDNKHVRAYVEKHWVMLPLYLYDHSGLSMSVRPFSCRFDSGQVGWIYVSRESKGYDDLTAGLTAEVENYNQYLTGDVWYYLIEDANGDVIDSCSGFFGVDNCRSKALHHAKHLSEKAYTDTVLAGLPCA